MIKETSTILVVVREVSAVVEIIVVGIVVIIAVVESVKGCGGGDYNR